MDVIENWLPIKLYGDLYEVSDLGNVRYIKKTGKLLNQYPDHDGYMTVSLRVRPGKWTTKKVHRLMLAAFIGPSPIGMVCCHNNGVRFDNRISNLRWDTISANGLDRRNHPSDFRGEKHPNAKLTYGCIERIRDMLSGGLTFASIGRYFDVPYTTISRINRTRTWGVMTW